MQEIALKDILISARQESYRMRHFYLGTEHLLISLLDIQGGLASSIIQEYGLAPEYVIDAIRRKVGKGSRHRLWAGVPNTPRTDIILGIAHDLALEDGREEINERDLLIALLEEQDSISVRVLKALGLNNSAELAGRIHDYVPTHVSQQPYIKIDFGPEFDRDDTLTKDQLYILRRMFYGYDEVRIERRLFGGYSNAMLIVVTPIHADSREDSPVVVKINDVDTILDEAQRYETHVKNKLPAMTARLEDKPIAPDTSDLAGIKYTLVAGEDRTPHDLRAVLQDWSSAKLGDWISSELYPAFGRVWWQQNRPYRFQVWREYDWMLPPILTLELAKEKQLPPDGYTIRMPVKLSRVRQLEYGDIVAIENFIVQKVVPERNIVQLAVGTGTDAARAFKIEVRGINLQENTFYRGEVVDSLIGRVWQTRNQQILQAIRELEPDFDPEAETIPLGPDSPIEKLPNPIHAYEILLDTYVNGSLSTVHGDLHPGNLMIGPSDSAFLIDFAHTREGHTVFDWANLEMSLLADYIMPRAGESWDAVYSIITRLIRFNGTAPMNPDEESSDSDLMALTKIREIVQQCLIVPEKWSEYFMALIFCGLRAVSWTTMPIAGRRLMYLVAALALHEIRNRYRPSSETDTPSPDETDINTYSY